METPLVQIDTAMGSFQVELYYRHAPQACKNFQELAKKGYYDGTIVSRSLPDQLPDHGLSSLHAWIDRFFPLVMLACHPFSI